MRMGSIPMSQSYTFCKKFGFSRKTEFYQAPAIDIQNASVGGLKNMLKYLYTGQLLGDYDKFEVGSEMLEVALQFGFLEMAAFLSDAIADSVESDDGDKALELLVCIENHKLGKRYQYSREKV